MGFSLSIDVKRRLVELRYEGTVDKATLLEALRSVNEQVTFDKIQYGISDFRGTRFEVEREDFPEFIAVKDPKLFSGARWAFLIDSPRETALSMVYTRMKEQAYDIETFSTREAALEWFEIAEA